MRHILTVILAFIALSASGQGIGAWQLETAPTGQHYLIYSDKVTGVFDTIPADRFISDSLGYSRIDSIKCVSDTIRIYTNNGQFKMPFSCSGGGGGGGSGDITGVFVEDYLTGGGAVGAVTIGIDTTGTIGVGTKFDFSKLDLVPYVYMGDTIGAILENIVPAYNDTLLFDYGDLASNPYNLIPYVSGGDTIGAILTGLNATSNDTLIFDSGDADFWQNVVLGSDNSTTTTDYPFTFTPNDNTRYKIRVEALLYSSDPGVGVRPVFLIDGTLTGYSDFSVNIVAPNGENSNIVVYGGYNDPSWTANTTGSTSYTMTAIFEITLITTTAPADVKIGFSSETGASVTMKKGSLFSYKTY